VGKQAPEQRLYSTRELAAAVGVTPRTVRFYEAQGLLRPQRAGPMRIYSYDDRAKLALIRRGKGLGYSLHDLAEVLDLYHADPRASEQMQRVRAAARARIVDLERKLVDLKETLRELRRLEQNAARRLALGHKKNAKGRQR
jgi:DNA-binding transcriptional MerR regulator